MDDKGGKTDPKTTVRNTACYSREPQKAVAGWGGFSPESIQLGAERVDKNSTRTCPKGYLVIKTLVRYLG